MTKDHCFFFIQQSLKSLKERLKVEEKEAVAEMERKCQRESEERVNEICIKHKSEIKEMEGKIETEKEEKRNIISEMEKIKESKLKIEERLKIVAESFQNFIETTKGFEGGQSDFLIPNVLRDVLDS